MPTYYLPCPHCRGKIEVDTDYDTSVECESCNREFDWRWAGKGSLALREDGEDPAYYYKGVGRFREWEDEDNNSISVKVRNETSHKLNVAVHYKDLEENWVTKGWFIFEPGVELLLPVETLNRCIYFYAFDVTGKNEWCGDGDYAFSVRGKECNFAEVHVASTTRIFTQAFE